MTEKQKFNTLNFRIFTKEKKLEPAHDIVQEEIINCKERESENTTHFFRQTTMQKKITSAYSLDFTV